MRACNPRPGPLVYILVPVEQSPPKHLSTMIRLPHFSSIFILLLFLAFEASAQESWSLEQEAVLAAMGRLSASTAPNGGGADEYGHVLAEDFSRWTIGSEVTTFKESWLQGIREWFGDGWRVSDRETQHLQIDVRGDFAFTRRIVKETYLGPDGDTPSSRAALAEVWIRSDNGWLLQYVTVHPLPNP